MSTNKERKKKHSSISTHKKNQTQQRQKLCIHIQKKTHARKLFVYSTSTVSSQVNYFRICFPKVDAT
jgi:hypothetical protein